MGAVKSWIEQHALRRPEAEAVVDLGTGTRLTYAELWGRIRAVACGLQSQYDVGAGDRVAIWSRNDVRTIETMYACALLGAVAVPLNWRLTPAELSQIVDDAEPCLLVAEDWAASEVEQVASHSAGDLPVLLWSSERETPDAYEQLAGGEVPAYWSATEVDDEEIWTIIYTSGTTGRPKGVMASHASIQASMLGIAIAHRISPESRCLTVLPTFHVAGLNLFTNPVLLAGGTVLLARAFDAGQALHLLRDAEPAVTHFCGVPANYQFMEQLPQFEDAPMRPFVAVVGGSPVPGALLESWRGRGVPLSAVFGITEAGACVTAVPPDRDPKGVGVVGLPVLHVQCRVQDTDANTLAAGEVGELQLRGQVVTSGYWRNPEATAAAFTPDGWLRTGDAASIDDGGEVVLVDRWKDMYISGGENVYPAEVENVLSAHPAIAQVAVVGAPDARWGEVGVAFVMTSSGTELDETEVLEYCAQRLARYKVPARVRVVSDLPRNATGKTLKGELRRLLDA